MEYGPLKLLFSNLRLYNPRLYEGCVKGTFTVPFGQSKGQTIDVNLFPEQVSEVRENENVAFVKPHIYKGKSKDGTRVLYLADENDDYQHEYGEYTISW